MAKMGAMEYVSILASINRAVISDNALQRLDCLHQPFHAAGDFRATSDEAEIDPGEQRLLAASVRFDTGVWGVDTSTVCKEAALIQDTTWREVRPLTCSPCSST